MVSATAQAAANGLPAVTVGRRISRLFHRFEAARSYSLLSPNLLVLLALLMAPFATLVVRSFWTQVNYDFDTTFTLHNYAKIFAFGWREDVEFFSFKIDWPFENAIYTLLLAKSVLMSLCVTATVILFAYPMAYFLAFRVQRHKMIWLVLISIPFWTSYLLRIFAWKVILGFQGVVNSALLYVGIIDEPLSFILYNSSSVVITLTHAWVTFVVLDLCLAGEDGQVAAGCGNRPGRHRHPTVFPHHLAAVGAGHDRRRLAGLHSDGRRVCDAECGRRHVGIMVGNLIQSLYGKSNDEPLGGALANVMMLTVALLVCLFLWAIGYRRMRQRMA